MELGAPSAGGGGGGARPPPAGFYDDGDDDDDGYGPPPPQPGVGADGIMQALPEPGTPARAQESLYPPPGGWTVFAYPPPGVKWPDTMLFYKPLVENGIPIIKHGEARTARAGVRGSGGAPSAPRAIPAPLNRALPLSSLRSPLQAAWARPRSG